MSNSREESPDWLRSFQAPTSTAVTLSLESDSSPESSPNDGLTIVDEIATKKQPLRGTSPVSEKDKDQDVIHSTDEEVSVVTKTRKTKSPRKQLKSGGTPAKKKTTVSRSVRKGKAKQEAPEGHDALQGQNHSVWALSSDSESCPDMKLKDDDDQNYKQSAHKMSQDPKKENDKDAPLIDSSGKSQLNELPKRKSPRKRLKEEEDEMPEKKIKLDGHSSKGENNGDMEVAEKVITEKFAEPQLPSSRLPLVLSEKVHRTKALVECDGDSIDLSGDMGSVGRVVISDGASKIHEMLLDLKGTIYRTNIVSSRTFCVVGIGQSEAKIEAIMNDFIQLKPLSNVYEAETMVEGTLDGFSFGSEDEAEKMPKTSAQQADENEGTEEKPNGKSKAKSAKLSGTTRKRGKSAGGKVAKKVKKKAQAPKKTKTKK